MLLGHWSESPPKPVFWLSFYEYDMLPIAFPSKDISIFFGETQHLVTSREEVHSHSYYFCTLFRTFLLDFPDSSVIYIYMYLKKCRDRMTVFSLALL
jgi:hypothetical protein